MVAIAALKLAMSFPLPKKLALFISLRPLSNGPTSDRKTEDKLFNDQTTALPSFQSKKKKNQVNTKHYWTDIEKDIVREVTWGDKHYLRKSADRKAQNSQQGVRVPPNRLICALQSAESIR